MAATPLDCVFPKKFVNLYTLEEARQAVSQVCHVRAPAAVIQYSEVEVSPLSVIFKGRCAAGGVPPPTLLPLASPLTEEDAIGVVRQLAQIVFSLHRRGVVHGMLRAEVLREGDAGQLFLLQTGLPPTLFARASRLGAEALRLAAPEIRANSSFGYASDIWGLGAVLLQLVSTRGAVLDTDDVVNTGVVSPVFGAMTPSAVSFLVQTLKADPSDRPTLEELAQHPVIGGGGSDGHGFTSEFTFVDRGNSVRHLDPRNGDMQCGQGHSSLESAGSSSAAEEDTDEDEDESEDHEEVLEEDDDDDDGTDSPCTDTSADEKGS